MGERLVSVVLDEPRRILPSFTVASPWWPDVEPVVAAVREEHGLDVVVLRVLAGEQANVSPVTYVAEVVGGDAAAAGEPWPHDLPDDALRLPYARPGGPAAELAWAGEHVQLAGRPVQVKTWNLSSIWRLPTPEGTVWLKHVPPFFAHEPLVIAALGPAQPVPRLVAGEPGRMLLADVEGYDCWEATDAQLAAIVDALVGLQVATIDRTAELLALGVADWRRSAFVAAASSVVARDAPPDDADVLGGLVDGLERRFDRLAGCGLPDVLVHGDAHPGNVRWSAGRPVLLDWGDCGIGQPLLDLPAFLGSAAVMRSGPGWVRQRWLGRWAEAVPGSEPDRAADLVAPIAALRQAIVYRGFLDGIEASERVYHRGDVVEWLGRAAALVRRQAAAGTAETPA